MGHATLTETHTLPLQGSTAEEPNGMDGALQPKSTALARFEFESGRGKNGSKVLMVEWDTALTPPEQSHGSPQPPDHESHSTDSAWKVSWEGMPVALPVRDRDEGTRSQERQFFLLPPGCQFPADITITHRTGLTVSAKALPAIFPEGLGPEAGTKGVLHTQWAKSRIADLEDEIRKEMSVNTESVGLEMVLQEKAWILDQFGIAPSPSVTAPPEKVPAAPAPKPQLPGRLADQFRGLKLATSPEGLAAAATARNNTASGTAPRVLSIPPPNGDHHANGAATAPVEAPLPYQAGASDPPAEEEDLFALPMSPRSPEMKRSPFSLL